MSLRSTSTRTFIVVPALVAVERSARRRGVHPAWLPVLAWGAAQYYLVGRYRRRYGGGPPGMSQGCPERLVTTGPYAYSRNPMYLGHLIFLAGLIPVSRSPVAVAAFVAAVPWFGARVRRDEERLTRLFGSDYRAYRAHVPRWARWPARPGGRTLARQADIGDYLSNH